MMSKTRVLWDDVVDVLNEQQSTITTLKEKNEQLQKTIDDLQKVIRGDKNDSNV